jgi:4-diphosphocytidyl-2-C-methyl-D-erythritol kinase
MEVAGLIGSDVPYCVVGGTARATGRGDELTVVPVAAELWFVLGISERPLYTADVYAAFDELDKPPDAAGTPMALALEAGDVGRVAELLHNDLEPAAFVLRPELADKKSALLDAGALGAALSGSGPTLFAVAQDPNHAEAVARRVAERFDRMAVVTSRRVCIESFDGVPYPLP